VLYIQNRLFSNLANSAIFAQKWQNFHFLGEILTVCANRLAEAEFKSTNQSALIDWFKFSTSLTWEWQRLRFGFAYTSKPYLNLNKRLIWKMVKTIPENFSGNLYSLCSPLGTIDGPFRSPYSLRSRASTPQWIFSPIDFHRFKWV
jgi:hypothetical protein